MRILHVGAIKPSRSAEGPSHSIRGLAAAQAKIGMEVGLLPSLTLRPDESMEETVGVCVLESPRKPHYNPWFISKDWIVHIREKFGEPDLVNFHSTYIPFHIALARQCRRLGWPYIVTPRGGMTYLAQNRKGIKKNISNLLYFRSYVKQAVAIHALCKIEAQEIGELFVTKKIITVPNGVDDYLLKAANRLQPAELGDFNSQGDLVLGFVGRIDIYHKGIDLLLEAMSILKKKANSSKCKLFVIGPYHTKRDEDFLCSIIKEYGLEDVVKLLGAKYNEEKLRYFMACDVFVHTSRFEGMPMAVLEAMALGRPCLVTPGTGVADMVCQGGGWQCQPDPNSIAETIKSIYENRNALKNLGLRSQELVRSRFTWRKIAQMLYEKYTKLN